jgi:hypothetical protein
MLSRSIVVVGLSLAVVLSAAVTVMAQALKDVQTSDKPLVLKAQGSFFVGGEKVEQTQGELGDLGPGGHITINQMYVRYMVPQGGDGNPPVVMVHGATLTGKSWETTPDGRMGWDEYFVRRGHPVYVPDQVGRGRSGRRRISRAACVSKCCSRHSSHHTTMAPRCNGWKRSTTTNTTAQRLTPPDRHQRQRRVRSSRNPNPPVSRKARQHRQDRYSSESRPAWRR